jgi:hypothetical protein
MRNTGTGTGTDLVLNKIKFLAFRSNCISLKTVCAFETFSKMRIVEIYLMW